MRALRLLGLLCIVAPTSALALQVPFIGSPFAHVTLPFFNSSDYQAAESQTADASAPSNSSKNSGTNDICYDETVSGGGKSVSSEGSNFSKCKDQKITKKDCKDPKKRALVGTATVKNQGQTGDKTYNRCDYLQGASKCSCVGDSLCVGLVNAGCNSGGAQILAGDNKCDSNLDPSHLACGSRNPQQVLDQIKNLSPDQVDQLKDGTVMLSPGCSNGASSCKACSASSPDSCVVKQQLDELQKKGIDLSSVQVMGVSDAHASANCTGRSCNTGYLDGVNSAVGQIFTPDTQAHFLGGFKDPSSDGIHPSNYSEFLPSQLGSPVVAGSDADYGTNVAQSSAQQAALPYAAQNAAGVASSLAPMCDKLGGCGNACSVSNGITCSNNNPGALTYAPWQEKYGGYACNAGIGQCRCDSNNTACFTTMEGGIAAHAGLLVGPKYYGSGEGTIANAASIYSTGNQSEYANFVSNATGIGLGQKVDPANAQQLGSIMMAQSKFENGKGVIYTPDQLEKGLTIMYGSQTSPVGSNIPPLNGISRGIVGSSVPTEALWTQNTSPNPQYQQQKQTTQQILLPAGYGTSNGSYGFGSPFNNSTLGMGLGSNLGSMFGNLFNKNSTAQTQNQKPPPPPPPTYSLTVQPQSVARGGSISVSWNSTGMSGTSPCTVTQNGVSLGSGNAGAMSVQTGTSTSASLVFRLLCQDNSGQLYQQTATVAVK